MCESNEWRKPPFKKTLKAEKKWKISELKEEKILTRRKHTISAPRVEQHARWSITHGSLAIQGKRVCARTRPAHTHSGAYVPTRQYWERERERERAQAFTLYICELSEDRDKFFKKERFLKNYEREIFLAQKDEKTREIYIYIFLPFKKRERGPALCSRVKNPRGHFKENEATKKKLRLVKKQSTHPFLKKWNNKTPLKNRRQQFGHHFLWGGYGSCGAWKEEGKGFGARFVIGGKKNTPNCTIPYEMVVRRAKID